MTNSIKAPNVKQQHAAVITTITLKPLNVHEVLVASS